MPALTSDEAQQATDALLITVYGDDLFDKWIRLKQDMNFTSERDYMSWLVDLAYSYQNMEVGEDEWGEPQREDDNLTHHALESDEKVAVGYTQQPSSITQDMKPPAPTVAPSVYQETDEIMPMFDEDTSASTRGGRGKGAARCVSGGRARQSTQSDSGTLMVGDGSGGRVYPCGYCQYVTPDRSNLRKHVRSVHLKLKSQSCPHCDYKCSEKLLPHLVAKHGYQPQHACQTCGKGFARLPQLKQHESKCQLTPSLLTSQTS